MVAGVASEGVALETGLLYGSLIRILVVVDVVGALATGSLDQAVWLVDGNKSGGSTDEGTRRLKTAVRAGDMLIWTAMSLECEAFAAIEAIEIDPAYCVVTQGTYEGTDIRYWLGAITQDPGGTVSYNLRLKVGSRTGDMSLSGPAIRSRAQ